MSVNQYLGEGSSSREGKSREAEGASTSDRAEDDQSDVDERDLFLQALLEPNEHAQRLLEVRTRVADLCRIDDILDYGVPVPVEDTLRSVVASCTLLREAGLMQDSLILLADDPRRPGVVQAVEIDVGEIEDLQRSCRETHRSFWKSSLLPGSVPHDKVFPKAARCAGTSGPICRASGSSRPWSGRSDPDIRYSFGSCHRSLCWLALSFYSPPAMVQSRADANGKVLMSPKIVSSCLPRRAHRRPCLGFRCRQPISRHDTVHHERAIR
jgi:hypothetical protein